MPETTPRRKATHYGHCQWCGARHKLPRGGVLAKHGYPANSRGGGFFTGACPGAGGLPYEQSKALIKKSITAAAEQRSRECLQRALLEADFPLCGSFAMIAVYRRDLSTRRLGPVYRWERTELWTDRAGTVRCAGGVVVGCGAQRDVIADGIKYYGRYLDVEITRLELYIERQRQRAGNWSAQPLEPIVPAELSQ